MQVGAHWQHARGVACKWGGGIDKGIVCRWGPIDKGIVCRWGPIDKGIACRWHQPWERDCMERDPRKCGSMRQLS